MPQRPSMPRRRRRAAVPSQSSSGCGQLPLQRRQSMMSNGSKLADRRRAEDLCTRQMWPASNWPSRQRAARPRKRRGAAMSTSSPEARGRAAGLRQHRTVLRHRRGSLAPTIDERREHRRCSSCWWFFSTKSWARNGSEKPEMGEAVCERCWRPDVGNLTRASTPAYLRLFHKACPGLRA